MARFGVPPLGGFEKSFALPSRLKAELRTGELRRPAGAATILADARHLRAASGTHLVLTIASRTLLQRVRILRAAEGRVVSLHAIRRGFPRGHDRRRGDHQVDHEEHDRAHSDRANRRQRVTESPLKDECGESPKWIRRLEHRVLMDAEEALQDQGAHGPEGQQGDMHEERNQRRALHMDLIPGGARREEPVDADHREAAERQVEGEVSDAEEGHREEHIPDRNARRDEEVLRLEVEDNQAEIKKILPGWDEAKKEFSTANDKQYMTGLKVVVLDEKSPVKAELFPEGTEFLTLAQFKEWLAKYNLTSS